MQCDGLSNTSSRLAAVQKAALLRVLQLRSKHADVSLRLAQMRNNLAESGSVSTTAAETCRSVQHAPRITRVVISAWSRTPAYAHACMQQLTCACTCLHAGCRSGAAGCRPKCRRCRLCSRGSGRLCGSSVHWPRSTWALQRRRCGMRSKLWPRCMYFKVPYMAAGNVCSG